MDYTERERMNPHVQAELRRHRKSYGSPREGTTRATFFVDAETVVKVPLDAWYIPCQYTEVEFDHPQIPLATCRLELTPQQVPLVYMERLRMPEHSEWKVIYKMDWPQLLQDGEQVGYTKDGRLVAYDVGSETPKRRR